MSLTKKYMEDISVAIGFDGEINPLVIAYCEVLNELREFLYSDVEDKDEILFNLLTGAIIIRNLASMDNAFQSMLDRYEDAKFSIYDIVAKIVDVEH